TKNPAFMRGFLWDPTIFGSEGCGIFRHIRNHSIGGRIHTFVTRLPASGTNFAVLLVEAEGVNHTQHFIHIATQRQIIDHLMANDTLFVDEERAAESDTGGRLDIVGLADFVLDIGNQGVFYRTDATVIDGG